MLTLEEAAALKLDSGLYISLRSFPKNPEMPQDIFLRNSAGDICNIKYYSQNNRVVCKPPLQSAKTVYRSLIEFICASIRQHNSIIGNEKLEMLLSATRTSTDGHIFYITSPRA